MNKQVSFSDILPTDADFAELLEYLVSLYSCIPITTKATNTFRDLIASINDVLRQRIDLINTV